MSIEIRKVVGRMETGPELDPRGPEEATALAPTPAPPYPFSSWFHPSLPCPTLSLHFKLQQALGTWVLTIGTKHEADEM